MYRLIEFALFCFTAAAVLSLFNLLTPLTLLAAVLLSYYLEKAHEGL